MVNPWLVSPHSQLPSFSAVHSTGSDVDGGASVGPNVDENLNFG